MQRRAFLSGAVTSAVVGLPRGVRAQTTPPAAPPGFTRLRITEGQITVEGKTGRAYRIQQDDGTPGYTGTRGERFRVALENATTEPVAIHWHGLILPNGQDGVPYVTQRPILPGEQRLYDFPLVQAGTYWMHAHFGFQEQPLMTAPLILRDPGAPPDEQDVVVMLNDFTTRDPAGILAGLQGGAPGAPAGAMRPGMSMQVTEIDGAPLPGAGRDTVLVLPRQTVKVQFDAAYRGHWMLHCHVLYHGTAGMMTVLRYEGFEDASYDPLASQAEFRR